VAVGSDPRRDRHNRLVAANRADRSGTRHAAGGITGQTLTTTTTEIIAVGTRRKQADRAGAGGR
jgi:hypothetical protein